MNRKELKDYLLSKDCQWQAIFCRIYLHSHGIAPDELESEFNIGNAVKFCQNEDAVIELWELVDFVESYYLEISEDVSEIRYSKPILWQKNFVDLICSTTGSAKIHSFELDAIIYAYATALSNPDIDLKTIIRTLDAKYQAIHDLLQKKFTLLKRNFLLQLEFEYGQQSRAAIKDLSFSAILQMYASKATTEGLINAYRTACTRELKLSAEEVANLAFAYYSPYITDEIDTRQNKTPDGCLFSFVHDCMKNGQEYAQKSTRLAHFDSEENEDEAEMYQPLEHDAAFADPQNECVIDVCLQHTLYANVYIQKFPKFCLKNTLPDFLILRKNFLYSVEFVDNLKDIPVADELISTVGKIREKLDVIEHRLQELPDTNSQKYLIYQRKRKDLLCELSMYYCIDLF